MPDTIIDILILEHPRHFKGRCVNLKPLNHLNKSHSHSIAYIRLLHPIMPVKLVLFSSVSSR
jgi:hypothetical protein